MAEAALKYEIEPEENLVVPEGGIATFLTATEGSWADEEVVPKNGIATVHHIADRLAEYGRYEDDYIVHAAEGETVVPLAVLDANPRLKKNLFKQMEIMGLEPERYVIGSELNSINPVTGQPEFFLKKLFKSIKKLVKKVVKVVKKAIPYILPIALAMTPLGPIFGSAMGSGIGTLAAGGDLKDALKASLIAGSFGGFATGIAGGVQSLRAGSTFMEGFKSAAGSAAGGIGERFKQFISPARAREFGGTYFGAPTREIISPDQAQARVLAYTADTSNIPPMREEFQRSIDARIKPDISRRTALANQEILPKRWPENTVTVGDIPPDPGGVGLLQRVKPTPPGDSIWDLQPPKDSRWVPYGEEFGGGPSTNLPAVSPTVPSTNLALDASGAGRTKLQKLGDIMFRGGKPPVTDAAEQAEYFKNVSNYLKEAKLKGLDPTSTIIEAGAQKAGEAAVAAMQPSAFARYGPSIALATGIGAAGGMFKTPEVEETKLTEGYEKTGSELLADYPERYTVEFPYAPTYQLSDIVVPGTSAGQWQPYGAQGGGVATLDEFDYPRRSGGITGPGTGRSDDVPAMLSDGEFVMTAKAVRGAGNGNRKNGMNNMYQLMRNFEAAR